MDCGPFEVEKMLQKPYLPLFFPIRTFSSKNSHHPPTLSQHNFSGLSNCFYIRTSVGRFSGKLATGKISERFSKTRKILAVVLFDFF
jgi:hypothetical protein